MACNGDKNNNDDKKDEVFATPGAVSSIERGSISANYHATATLEARNDAQVVTRVTGIIEHLVVEEGDYVTKGQLLAKIDSRRYQLSLDKASTELASIEQELKRLKTLGDNR